MKKTMIRNICIIAAMVVLIYPYVEYTRRLAPYLLHTYVPLFLYAICCGVLYALLDFSNQKVNIGLFALFTLISLVYIFFPSISNVYPIYRAIEFFLFMAAATGARLFAKNNSFVFRKEIDDDSCRPAKKQGDSS